MEDEKEILLWRIQDAQMKWLEHQEKDLARKEIEKCRGTFASKENSTVRLD